MSDELENLVVDESEVARKDLADALRPYLRFTREGGLQLRPEFDDLRAQDKVLCVVLGLKGLEALGYRDTASASPAEIVEYSGMAPGTVRPKLSELTKARQIHTKGGEYSLPSHSVPRAIARLKDHEPAN
jgi:hypothetical protein